MRSLFILSLVCALTTSCMPHSSSLDQSGQTASDGLGCTNMKSKVFDSMYEYLETQQTAPGLGELKSVLNEKIDALAAKQGLTDQEKIAELKTEFGKVFELLLVDSKNAKDIQNVKEHIQTLIELEMQDQSTATNVNINSKLATQFQKVNSATQALGVQCESQDNPDLNDPTEPSSTQARMIAGQNNVFATVYQSCQALQVPEISAATPNVQGITRLEEGHPDGVGGKRIISDLKAVQSTHPYIRVSGDSSNNGCFSVYKNPLIYDYGGKPATSGNVIDFFKNSGSGTSVLGVDCSGFVTAAIASAGFRYTPGTDNKAVYANQKSTKFIDAESSGFKCFQNITVDAKTSILPGDVGAIAGHVVMIDKVSADPFGVKKVTSLAGCDAMTEANFDFTISQSSPSKNGVGINKIIAKDYLKDQGGMKTLFVEMAKATCKATFQNKAIKPKSSAWGIVRHKGTPECLAPRIQIANESCVSQCRQ